MNIYSSTYFRNYIELQENNSILIGHRETSLGIGTIDGNYMTNINPNPAVSYIGRAVNVEIDDYIYESRRISNFQEDLLTGLVLNMSYDNVNEWYVLTGSGTFFNTEISVNDYVRVNGNLNTYLKVLDVVSNTEVHLEGNSWLGLKNKSIYLFKGIEFTKTFRENYSGKEIFVNSYTNNVKGLLQYDEFGNFLNNQRVRIDSCQEMTNIDFGKGILIHNEEMTKSCIIYGTFDSFVDTNYASYSSDNFEGDYSISENEFVYYKINAFRVNKTFSQANSVYIDELSENRLFQVQLNGIKLVENIDYTVNYASNIINFSGSFLSNFNNVVSLIVYSNQQDIIATGCTIRLTVKGYDENLPTYNYYDYFSNLRYCRYLESLSAGANFTTKQIETLDNVNYRERIVATNNKATFKQILAYEKDVLDGEELTVNIFSYVGGYEKYFRIVRIDDLFTNIEIYNDCVFVDPVQKTSNKETEEYAFTLKYKERKEYALQTPENVTAKNINSYLLLSRN